MEKDHFSSGKAGEGEKHPEQDSAKYEPAGCENEKLRQNTAQRTYALLCSSSFRLYQLNHPQDKETESHNHGGYTIAPGADKDNKISNGRNSSNFAFRILSKQHTLRPAFP